MCKNRKIVSFVDITLGWMKVICLVNPTKSPSKDDPAQRYSRHWLLKKGHTEMKFLKAICSVNSNKRNIPTKAYSTRLYLSINCGPLNGPYKPNFLEESTMKGPMFCLWTSFGRPSQKLNLQIKKTGLKCLEKVLR